MGIFTRPETVQPGDPIRAADIAELQMIARAVAGMIGDGASFDGTAFATRRLGRRRDDVATVRVLGRASGVGLDGFWDWEEVGLAKRKIPPLVYEWQALKRSSDRGHGLLWLQGMQDAAGARGFSHLKGIPVVAFKVYTRGTLPFWYGIPSAQPVQQPFMARVAAASPSGASTNNRWTYTLREVERRLLVAAVEWVDTTTQPANPGRVVTGFALAEANNAATGVQGHGVNVANLTGTFRTQSIPVGSIVLVYPLTVRPALGAEEAVEYWFERTNGVDGACP